MERLTWALSATGSWVDHPTLKRDNGEPVISFAMLTVNADGHKIFQRMRGPQDEKRMPIILTRDEYDEWLTCSPEDAKQYFRQRRGELKSFAKLAPPRKRRRLSQSSRQ